MSTLFERLGGRDAVDQAVRLFYRRVLTDERISRFFDDVDMDRQMAKQAAFLTMAFGGPTAYDGKDMRDAHAHLLERGLNDGHVDAVVEHLVATLRELGAAEADIREVTNIAEGARADVLGR
ncbi:MAG: group 1 truncated hemoglobin [Planctomycetota bacterium JB042]